MLFKDTAIFLPLNKVRIQHNISLKPFNTFGIDVSADYFAACKTTEDLKQALRFAKEQEKKILVLGGGSNILFRSDFNGLVIKNEIKGIEVQKKDDSFIVEAGAGENWHKLVMYCVEHSLCGIENLALIPGCCGAAPIQNIGAYGIEIKDVLKEVHFIDLNTLNTKILNNKACMFGYRDSIFKNALKGQFIITKIVLTLHAQQKPNTSYGAIHQVLKQNNTHENPNIVDVANAVIKIRTSKLPDPKILGNAGSFFKNPIISQQAFNRLKLKHPDIAGYPIENANSVKVAAGWLIEKAGFKGYREGDVGSHKQQALVIVNHGNATGNDIYTYSEEIIKKVKAVFGIELEREVNCV